MRQRLWKIPKPVKRLKYLKKFNKLVCKTAMGQRYKNQCEAGREIATKAGGSVD